MKIGLLPLARNTFDVPYAETRLRDMLERLEATEHSFVGPRAPLYDTAATRAAMTDILKAGVDRLLILQVTFTDAAMTVEAAASGVPLSIWALPEPRLGERLRLNAFCGLNLAGHALGLRSSGFSWAYAGPEALPEAELAALLAGSRKTVPPVPIATGKRTAEAKRAVDAVAGRRIARIGEHPDGFDTCAYDAGALKALADVDVEAIPLERLFADARGADAGHVERVRVQATADVSGLEDVDQAQLDRSLRLRVALDGLRTSGEFSAFAIRCWPETFTEYGGAVCGPVSMMGQAGTPCACEADVYGALSQMILQEVSGSPVFLTDLVDIDSKDDSAVIWHCGQAPISMRDPEASAEATIHTNRKMPLLYQFPLKPGRVTLMRISQAFGQPKMVLSGASMLKRPMAFTGTSGVLRFDRPAGDVLSDIIDGGIEHHLAVVYGDFRPALRDVAATMKLDVLEV